MFEKLKREEISFIKLVINKILFYNPKEASMHVNLVSSDINKWWQSSELQNLRNDFVNHYALTSNKDGENNNLHMCDRTHLSPKCLSILFENYLHKFCF